MAFRFKMKQFHAPFKISPYTLLPYLIISVFVVLAYLPSFSGSFILDDNPLIKNNSYLKEFRSLSSYLNQEDGIPDKNDSGRYHTGYYRPLINLTYWLDFKLWGMKAPGFRTSNLIMHLLSCFVLFKLLFYLLRNTQAAFWTVCIFSLHPVNTESVSWITSRNNILVTLFVLSSLHFYISGWERKQYISMIFSVLFFVFAVLSKEFGLMLLPLFFLYQRFLSKERSAVTQELITYLPFVIIAIIYFILRKGATGSLLTPSGIEDLWSRIYFSPYLIVRNLQLVFLPYNLHSFSIPYPSSYTDWRALFSITMVLLIGGGLWFIRRKKLILFSGLSFLFVIFPVLNIIPTSAVSLISMRWLYLPMALLAIGISSIFHRIISIQRKLFVSVLCLVIIYFGAYSFVLNKTLWHDEETFFQQEVYHFNNLLYAGGLAEKLLDKGEFPAAEKYFLIAIENYPNEVDNYINYSALLIDSDRQEAAKAYLNKAKPLVRTSKERGEWFNNMGMIYFRMNKKEEAIRDFLKAVEYFPEEPVFWANLGGAYGSTGYYKKSMDALLRGLEFSPESILIRKNLASSYMRAGEYKKAVEVLEVISALDNEDDESIGQLLDTARSKLLKDNR